MLYSSNILFMPLLVLSPTKKNQQTSERYALPSETRMVVERENSLNLSNFFIFMRRLLIWRSWGGVFGRAGEFLPVTPPVIASSSLLVIARSEATKQSPLLLHSVIANRRVGKCSGVKQSPHCTFLLVLGVLERLLRLIVIRLAMTLWGYRLAMTLLPVIASPSLPVIARSEATKQSPLTLHPVIANRRVGKCSGVKQSPHCTFLLVLSVRGGLLRSLRSLAMTLWGYRACNGNFSQVNKEKKLKKNKIINQQKLNTYGN